jgi:hypothetical protein
MVKNKKCDCGHSKNEHMLTQKKICQYWISYYFMTGLQLYKRVAGECMKCHCPEYKPPSKFNARRGVDYTLRTTKNDVPEKRCTRCGGLLVNHENIDHSFLCSRTPL